MGIDHIYSSLLSSTRFLVILFRERAGKNSLLRKTGGGMEAKKFKLPVDIRAFVNTEPGWFDDQEHCIQ